MSAVTYPAHIDAELDPKLSRWIWLVKWFLVIPHLIVLAFLWIAFVVLSVVAFFAILFTGRYPRGIFEFNVGVLRWTWRVQYYTYAALGTDRYPPFTLEDVPDYPAHFEVEYPQHLSRGLVLIKWWLLAIPHYLIVGILVGGTAWAAGHTENSHLTWGGGGLISLLVIISAIALAFTGRYPQTLFDLILGLNRWVLRVAAYAGLMTDEYPPFRLDLGGHEPAATVSVPASGPAGPAGPTSAPAAPGAARSRHAHRRTGWTPARIVGVVAGSVLALLSVGMLTAGGTTMWADRTQRDAAGYLSLGTDDLHSTGYAIASDRISLKGLGVDWGSIGSIVGKVRFQVRSTTGSTPTFIGIAASDAATSYLDGTAYTTAGELARHNAKGIDHPGTSPSVLPTGTNIWTASASGSGTQTLIWPVENGTWTIVAMNADGSANVNIEVKTAATLPALPWIATGLLVGGAVFFLAGLALIVLPVRRASIRDDEGEANAEPSSESGAGPGIPL